MLVCTWRSNRHKYLRSNPPCSGESRLRNSSQGVLSCVLYYTYRRNTTTKGTYAAFLIFWPLGCPPPPPLLDRLLRPPAPGTGDLVSNDELRRAVTGLLAALAVPPFPPLTMCPLPLPLLPPPRPPPPPSSEATAPFPSSNAPRSTTLPWQQMPRVLIFTIHSLRYNRDSFFFFLNIPFWSVYRMKN